MHISAGERHGFGATAPLSTRTLSLEHEKSRRSDLVFTEADQTSWVSIDLCRRVTRTNHSFCCTGGPHALASFGVWRYVCLHGKTVAVKCLAPGLQDAVLLLLSPL